MKLFLILKVSFYAACILYKVKYFETWELLLKITPETVLQPHLVVSVNKYIIAKKTKVKAVIDTGAYHFHLKDSFIIGLDLENISETKSNNPIQGILDNGVYIAAIELVPPNKGFIPDIKIASMRDSFNYDFIIGTQFFKGNFFSYDGERRTWKITF